MKYPRFFALILTIIIAILFFSNKNITSPENFLIIENYLSSFTIGMLYAYSFTAAMATGALLVVAEQQNIIITGITAGLGALMGDLIIFKFVRNTFNSELKELGKTKLMKKVRNFLKRHARLNLAIPIIAYFIIASPLPDEIGVTMVAAYRDTTTRAFSIISFLLNTTGIFTILILGRAI